MLGLDICWFVLICYYRLCVTEVHAIFTHHSSKVGIVFTLCVCMYYKSRCLYVCLSTQKGSDMHLTSKWRPSLIMIWEVTCSETGVILVLYGLYFITLRWSLWQHFGVHCTPVFLLPEATMIDSSLNRVAKENLVGIAQDSWTILSNFPANFPFFS